MYECFVCMCVPCAYLGQLEDPLKLEYVVSHPTWVQGTELGSFEVHHFTAHHLSRPWLPVSVA